MRPGVSHLLKLCVLGEFYARFSQDAQVNETLLRSIVVRCLSPFSMTCSSSIVLIHVYELRIK